MIALHDDAGRETRTVVAHKNKTAIANRGVKKFLPLTPVPDGTFDLEPCRGTKSCRQAIPGLGPTYLSVFKKCCPTEEVTRELVSAAVGN